jgi:GT2 family glycosyltransferase
MNHTVPVAVIIPTYNRGMAVLAVLQKLQECHPRADETWVHVDSGDGVLEKELSRRFPHVNVLTSSIRVGPGGGRHRCLLKCSAPYAVSFDDDSYPVDFDFFGSLEQVFGEHPDVAIIGASIWHRHEVAKIRTKSFVRRPNYIGCGYAIRLAAYRQVRGYVPRPRADGIEESDVSLQLFAAGWKIYESGDLRVFHDTDLAHHHSSEVTSGVIVNVGLYAFLNYPVIGWARGFAQVVNKVVYCVRMGRFRGICSGLCKIPVECYRYRKYRRPISWRIVRSFLQFRKTGVL